MVTGKLTTLQMSASPARSQQVDSFAQVLLLEEFMLFTCKATAEEHGSLSSNGSSISTQTQSKSTPSTQHVQCALTRVAPRFIVDS